MKAAKYSNRRREVAEAAWCVIARDGLEGASMRAIAQELGATTGVVNHYFRDKDELMLFALERVFENLYKDMEACANVNQGVERLEQMILAVLPLAPKGIQGWLIWIAFLGYAIGRNKLIEEHQKRYDSLREMIYQELAALKNTKLIRDDIDLRLEANALIAFVDGIGIGCAICPDQFHPEQQRYLVKRYITTLLPVSQVSN